MGILEMIMLGAGAIIFIISFCIPVKEEKLKEQTRILAVREVKGLVAEELETIRGRLTELSEEEMKQQIEKSERTMERISNEKIMAVNEYSDTVLEEIHKNHEEVVFLYDMLKNKKASLSESYEKVDQNLQDLLQQVKDSEITVREGLGEISKKQKEFEEVKAEAEKMKAEKATVQAASEKKKPAAARRGRKPAAEPEKEKMPEPKQEAAVEEGGFKPFVPEKIEVAPNKTRTGKAEKKSETIAAPSADNMDVMLLLSNTVEDSAEGNSNERILELHKAGKSNMAIARDLGLGIGEVKLVIDLYDETK